jgi:hypothetical protein
MSTREVGMAASQCGQVPSSCVVAFTVVLLGAAAGAALACSPTARTGK